MAVPYRVVVIGGGIAGVSTLYHLVQLGWTDVALLERDELTSGSTWHAAGQVTQFSLSPALMQARRYTIDLYSELCDDPDHPIAYSRTGSVRVALVPERMDECRRACSVARSFGIDFELLDTAECGRRQPLLDTDRVLGGLWDPRDGNIDPTQLTNALAARARAGGASIFRRSPVTGLVERSGGGWRVSTPKDVYECDIVVNATGYRAHEIAGLIGVEHPSVTLEHQYIVTDNLPELEGFAEKLPILRVPEMNFYLRQEGQGLLLGMYEQTPQVFFPDGVPDDFTAALCPDALDRVADEIAEAMTMVPAMERAGIKTVVNGPIAYTPDGEPLVGPVPGKTGFYACCGIRPGIGEGGGIGKCLAEIIVHGHSEWDSWDMDPRRFTGHATRSYTTSRALEVYRREYAPHFPFAEWPAGRPAKVTPLFGVLRDKGAVFGARNGWERPALFLPDTRSYKEPTTFQRPDFFDVIGAECRAVRERVGIMDAAGFARFEVRGKGARAFLSHLATGRIPKPGRMALSYFCSAQGTIVSEATITCFADDRFWLLTASAAEWHDLDWLTAHAPADGSVEIVNLTARYGVLNFAGPRSGDVLSLVTDAELSLEAFPFMSVREITIGPARLHAMRLSYTGEMGWEFQVPIESLVSVYQTLWDAGAAFGIADFGLYALDSLRLEKCFRSWKHDFSTEDTPLEAGLMSFVDLGKPGFLGQAALAAHVAQGPARRLVPFLVDCDDHDPYHGATILHDGRPVGRVTSGGYGHAIGRPIALGYIDAAHAAPDTRCDIDLYGKLCPAWVSPDPIYDPQRLRPRGL